jgi:hypothetical protein
LGVTESLRQVATDARTAGVVLTGSTIATVPDVLPVRREDIRATRL